MNLGQIAARLKAAFGFVTAQTNLTGVIGIQAANQTILSGGFQRPLIPTGKQMGMQIVDWSNVTINAGTKVGTQATTTSYVKGSSVGYSIAGVSGCLVDVGTVGTPLAIAGINQIGFWAYNPDTVAHVMFVYLMNTAANFTNFSYASVAVQPGSGFYTISRNRFDLAKTGTGFAWASPLQQIRFKPGASGESGGGPLLTDFGTAGVQITFGGVFINSKLAAKPQFLIYSDDGKASNVVPSVTAITGGDAVSRLHSLKSFIQSYGYSYTACIIGRVVDQGGYLTANQIKSMSAEGVVIANHCYNFGTSVSSLYTGTPGSLVAVSGISSNCGLRALGQYGYSLSPAGAKSASYDGTTVWGTVSNDGSLIVSEINAEFAHLDSLGIPPSGHFVLPEGGYDSNVCAAIDSIARMKTVRGTDPSGKGTWGIYSALNNSAEGRLWVGRTPFIPGGLQLDNPATTTAVVDTYLADLLQSGGVGAAFIHDFNHTDMGSARYSDTNTKQLLDRLSTTYAATIDVITAEDYWNLMPIART